MSARTASLITALKLLHSPACAPRERFRRLRRRGSRTRGAPAESPAEGPPPKNENFTVGIRVNPSESRRAGDRLLEPPERTPRRVPETFQIDLLAPGHDEIGTSRPATSHHRLGLLDDRPHVSVGALDTLPYVRLRDDAVLERVVFLELPGQVPRTGDENGARAGEAIQLTRRRHVSSSEILDTFVAVPGDEVS